MEQETKKEVDKRNGYQEIISMEEYLDKRRKMKRNEKSKMKKMQEKSPAWILAGLYM
ncbi:hypothetical protein [Sporofaciens sp. SGI.106]|uniref:hypothetical protein n=1 Tax=Sporofaciens sp. SGI.106 TaxID=3420568 RepID=UPI002A9B4935|nr:hypothetical protein [Lachnoclostridium sp.]